jgi:hypothetical protein
MRAWRRAIGNESGEPTAAACWMQSLPVARVSVLEVAFHMKLQERKCLAAVVNETCHEIG